MSDQMPDEVLIDRRMHAWRPDSWHLLDRREGQVRYVRVDLFDSALAVHTDEYNEMVKRAEQAEAERDALRQQAEGWAQEARTQRATVHECYQACTGATGEPGDWHGAEPVRAVVAEQDRLRAALEEIHAYAHECSTGPAVPDHMWHIRGLAQEALSHD